MNKFYRGTLHDAIKAVKTTPVIVPASEQQKKWVLETLAKLKAKAQAKIDWEAQPDEVEDIDESNVPHGYEGVVESGNN